MNKLITRTALGLVIVFAGIQVFRPARTNPPVDQSKTLQATAAISAEASAILERSCRDCHSSETTWPWYSEVAPVSWLLVDDVNHGRRRWSLSDWGTYDAGKKRRALQGICEQVESGEMPMSTYLLMHRAAKLSDADKTALCAWTKAESLRLPEQTGR